MADRGAARWRVVVPVKPGEVGKSRLRTDAAALGAVDRAALARAIALDTIHAAAQVADVVVVTDDPVVARGVPAAVTVVADPGGGLDAAIAAGMRGAEGGFRAALLGDLPALRAADLAAALAAAASHERAVVADADGTGTTLLAAGPDIAWASAFGTDSLARHRALGAARLDAAASLRRDVDTPADLAAAAALGLGPHTAALLTAAAPA